MKKTSNPPFSTAPSEDDIRAYARHLFEQSGRIPDRDIDNWLEAKACLESNVAPEQSHLRLHRHLQTRRGPESAPRGFTMPPSDAALLIAKAACEETAPATRSAVAEASRTVGPDKR